MGLRKRVADVLSMQAIGMAQAAAYGAYKCGDHEKFLKMAGVKGRNVYVTERLAQHCRGEEYKLAGYLLVVNRAAKILREETSIMRRAKLVHQLTDDFLDDFKRDPHNGAEVWATVTCKAGCHFCCAQQVALLPGEAEILRALPVVSEERLVAQSLYSGVKSKEFRALPVAERWCPYLDKGNGLCTVYESRPFSCRDHFTSAPARVCDTSEGSYDNIPFLNLLRTVLLAEAAQKASLLKRSESIAEGVMRVRKESPK